MDTEKLGNLCKLTLPGKSNKVAYVRDQKSTLYSTLHEFGLETLSYWITNFSVVKAQREMKLNYYIEGIQTDISTKQLMWGWHVNKEIWNLLFQTLNNNKFKFSLCLINYAKAQHIRGTVTNQQWVESVMLS